jgi:hypothetical protein
MQEPFKIKDLYIPSQPTVRNSKENVAYHEVFPDAGLSNHIYCYWQLVSKKPLPEPFLYRAVADGCIDIIIDCKWPYSSRILGFFNTYSLFPLGDSFNYIGIRFLPSAFSSIFHINASELSNRVEPLECVLPKVSVHIGNIVHESPLLKELKESFDCYFLKLFSNLSGNTDKRLCSALVAILTSKGNLAVEKDLNVGLSSRQLRRLFEFYLGDTPKAFSKVVRFQSMLRAKPTLETMRKNKIFYDFGYFDQAHFIKDFKTFYGLPPTAALL